MIFHAESAKYYRIPDLIDWISFFKKVQATPNRVA